MDASFDVDRMPGWTRKEIDVAISRLPADPVGCVVAEDGGAIVGYCAPRLDDLTVHPDQRRLGHGRRLARAALDLAAEAGLTELTLFVPTHLPGSVAFATAIGLAYSSSLWLFRLPGNRDGPAARPARRLRPRALDRRHRRRRVRRLRERCLGRPPVARST